MHRRHGRRHADLAARARARSSSRSASSPGSPPSRRRTARDAIGPHGIFATGRSVFVTNGGPTEPQRGTPPVTVLRDPTLVAEEPVSKPLRDAAQARQEEQGAQGRRPLALRAATRTRTRSIGNPAIDSNAVDVLPFKGPPDRRRRRRQQPPPRQEATARSARSRCSPTSPTDAFGDDDPDAGRAHRRGQGPGRGALHEPADRLPVPVRRRLRVPRRTRRRATTSRTRPASRTSSTSTSGATARSTCSRSTATRCSRRSGRPTTAGSGPCRAGGGTPAKVDDGRRDADQPGRHRRRQARARCS